MTISWAHSSSVRQALGPNSLSNSASLQFRGIHFLAVRMRGCSIQSPVSRSVWNRPVNIDIRPAWTQPFMWGFRFVNIKWCAYWKKSWNFVFLLSDVFRFHLAREELLSQNKDIQKVNSVVYAVYWPEGGAASQHRVCIGQCVRKETSVRVIIRCPEYANMGQDTRWC